MYEIIEMAIESLWEIRILEFLAFFVNKRPQKVRGSWEILLCIQNDIS